MTTTDTPRAGTREWCALAALCLAVLLVTIDATVLALAIPSLSADLDPTGTQVLWIGDVYSFVLAGLLVPMGALGDRIGRKRLLLIGAAAFGVASALSAYAPTAELLILARLLLGVAGATIMPSTLSLIRTLFDDARQRTTAIGIWSATSTAGAVLGPILGGFLLEHFWWGSVFLVNVPVVAAFLLVAPRLLPEVRAGSTGRFDMLGAALALVGIVTVVFGIKELAGGGSPWIAAGAVALGAAVLVAFVRRQRR
ncbi:MAG: MFS transporter, partial [Pseudonocardia sp.]|nr:MFS transporter [Pseudonocardia sp.]